MRTLLEIYFAISCFFTGVEIDDDLLSPREPIWKKGFYLIILLLFMPLILIYGGIAEFGIWLYKAFQLKFYWHYFILKDNKYKHPSEDFLKKVKWNIGAIGKIRKPTLWQKHMLFIAKKYYKIIPAG